MAHHTHRSIPKRIQPESPPGFDRLLEKAHVKENHRPHWRRWLACYLAYCDEYDIDPVDEHNETPFVEWLIAQGKEQWQSDQARRAVGLYYELVGGYRARGACRSTSRTAPTKGLSEQWSKVLDDMTATIATMGLSESTRSNYIGWARRFARANNGRDPSSITATQARLFLEELAIDGRVAASTQNLAFNSLLFLYKNVLSIPFEGLEKTLRAKRPRTLPTVLTVAQVRDCLEQFQEPQLLVAELLYGCGLRLHEGLRLRMQDLDLENRMLTVRRGKGGKDRTVPLPETLIDRLQTRMQRMHRRYEKDRRLEAFEGVFLPRSMQNRDARAAADYAWYWLFPAAELTPTDSGGFARSHMHARVFQRAMRTAVEKAGIPKRATPHTFRHSFATHLLLQGANICQVQQLMGHADVRTTMIYLHVAKLQTRPTVSPLDRLYAPHVVPHEENRHSVDGYGGAAQ